MTLTIKSYNGKEVSATYAAAELTGSEKQISWAQELRGDIAACISFMPDEKRDEMTMKVVQWMFENITDSKLYIENRLPRGANSAKIELQKEIQKIVGVEKIKEILSA